MQPHSSAITPAEMEVPGLIPGTDLRPADILTSALGNAGGTLPWMSPFAPRTPPRLVLTALSPGSSLQTSALWTPPGHSSPPKHLLLGESSRYWERRGADLVPVRRSRHFARSQHKRGHGHAREGR